MTDIADLNLRPLREAIVETVREVLQTLRPILTSERDFHSLDRTAKDRTDRTRELDVKALEIYERGLSTRLPGTPALLCSEENPGGQNLTAGLQLPDLIFIVDPIDNTDGAIHGSPCYTAISVYLRSMSTVIAAAVGDFFQGEIYFADEQSPGAFKSAVGDPSSKTELRPSPTQLLAGAYITLYTLKPGRLIEAARADKLLRDLGDDGRVDCIGGAASLCKVAAGYVDAAVEFVKGFQVYDLFPGAYILSKSGGHCYSPDTGEPVSLALPFSTQDQLASLLKTRQRFVAAATMPLCVKLLTAIPSRIDPRHTPSGGGR